MKCREKYIIATYYSAAKPCTNIIKFASTLAVEQTTGTWIQVPEETPELKEKFSGRVVGVYEAPAYQIVIPDDVKERQLIIRIAFPWRNFGTQFDMMLSTIIGNISSSGKLLGLTSAHDDMWRSEGNTDMSGSKEPKNTKV